MSDNSESQELISTRIDELIRKYNPDEPNELRKETLKLFSKWCRAVCERDRDRLKLVTECLESATDRAFRFGKGRRLHWSLTDWGHCWETVSNLGRHILWLDKDGVLRDDLQEINRHPNGKNLIKLIMAFLDKCLELLPMSIEEIALEVYSNEGDAIQKAYNTIFQLENFGLVQRVGHQRDIYELTLRGLRVAGSLNPEIRTTLQNYLESRIKVPVGEEPYSDSDNLNEQKETDTTKTSEPAIFIERNNNDRQIDWDAV